MKEDYKSIGSWWLFIIIWLIPILAILSTFIFHKPNKKRCKESNNIIIIQGHKYLVTDKDILYNKQHSIGCRTCN
jgi:hypothetical protein